jgi:hypothetical protein
VSFFARNNRRDEAIPPSGHGLDKLRGFWVILQNLAYFADCTPDAVVRIQEDVVAPNPDHDFVATYDFSPALDQQNQDLERDRLQLHHMIAPAQPTGTDIKLEVFAEADRFLHPNWIGSHAHPMEEEGYYTKPDTPM